MKATELMVNDWVNSDFGIFQINEIFDDAVRDSRGNDYEFDCIHPILLTGEILKSNGFKLISDSDRVTNAFIDLYDLWECEITQQQTLMLFYKKYSKDYSLHAFRDNISNIVYVHELQNAMRVCGVEKEVEVCQI